MYTITHDSRPLFDPAGGHHIESPVLSREANKLGTLEFTIYPDNPEFDQITIHTSRFDVYRDGKLIISLRPVHRKNTMAGGVTWRCEELAAQMDDVLHRPDYFTGTISNYMARMISTYNEMAGVSGAVQVGRVTFISTQTDTFINDDYEGFWEGLVTHLTDVYGGYLIPRYSDGVIYIDYMTDEDLKASAQTVRFGENMQDMFMETESADIFSVLIPLGPDEDVPNPHPGQSSQRPMTIASVNGGKDYVENAAGIALYGRREKTQQWRSATSAADLKAKGQAYLDEHAVQLKKSVTLSAVDLHYLDKNIASIEWMTRLTVRSEVHDIDAVYTVTRLDLHLGTPQPLKIQLGDPQEVLTDRLPLNSVSKRRSGSGGGRGRRGGGGGGRAVSVEEFETDFTKTNREISLRAYQRDMTNVEEILRQAGMSINAQGVLIYADDAPNMVGSKFNVQADRITSEVTDRTNADSTLSSRITQTASEITLKAGKVTVDALSTYINNLITGVTTATYIKATMANINSLNLTGLAFAGSAVLWKEQYVLTGLSGNNASVSITGEYNFSIALAGSTRPYGTIPGRLVTKRTNGSISSHGTTIHYLGGANT